MEGVIFQTLSIEPEVVACIIYSGGSETNFPIDAPFQISDSDDIHASFYQTYWSMIGLDVANVILKCLNGEMDICELNDTCIVLIPKVKTPMSMMNFVLSVSTMTISKVLVALMKLLLGKLINPSESAFVNN